MTDDIPYLDDENRSADHQQVIDACQHAIDALHGGDLSRARSFLDEARAAVEHDQHDDTGQASRETAFDCHG